MLKELDRNQVEEIKCEVTLRLVNGEPADEITKILVDFLPATEEVEEVEEVEETQATETNYIH